MAREYVEAEVLATMSGTIHTAVLSADERVAIWSALMEFNNVPGARGAFSSDPPFKPPEPLMRQLATAFCRAGERVLREHHDSIFINRCPRCSRIAKTPLTRQCTWCRHDWHGPSAG